MLYKMVAVGTKVCMVLTKHLSGVADFLEFLQIPQIFRLQPKAPIISSNSRAHQGVENLMESFLLEVFFFEYLSEISKKTKIG